MKLAPISPRFPDDGVCITGSGPLELDRAEIIGLFEKRGALLFRGFDLPPGGILAFTDRFTEQYRKDTERLQDLYDRPVRVGDLVANVTLGSLPLRLHSEAAHGLVWPEVLWFYCNVPSTTGAHTTCCDGVRLWRALSPQLRSRFLAMPVRYEIELPTRVRASGGQKPWPFEQPGVSGVIDHAAGVIRLSIVRPAVHLTRTGELAFANYILHAGADPEVRGMAMADGTPIDEDMLHQLWRVGDELAFDIEWQQRDLIMLDNRRFMHGRRAIGANDPRDMFQIQTVRASFSFEASTRTALS